MNTEIDMGKLNDWLESVRNTFINASELASKVAGMQQQVNEMSQTLDGLRQLNRTLDENLSWSRSERDRLDNALRQSQSELEGAKAGHVSALNELANQKTLADERASIIATLKSENDNIAYRNMELEEENASMKKRLTAVENAIHGIGVTSVHEFSEQERAVPITTQSEPVKTVEPFVHPVTGVVQGRDPETKQFVPIKEDGKQGDNKPWWDDEGRREGGAGF